MNTFTTVTTLTVMSFYEVVMLFWGVMLGVGTSEEEESPKPHLFFMSV